MDTTYARSGRRHGKVLRIFAIICLALVLACGGVVTYVYLNFRSLAAGILRGPVMQQIQSADLPAGQKAGITRTIDRLTEDFKKDRLSYQQLTAIFERLGRGRSSYWWRWSRPGAGALAPANLLGTNEGEWLVLSSGSGAALSRAA